MREIIFRGKRIDNGKWVYGSLVNNLFFRNNDSQINYIIPNDFDYDCWQDVGEIADNYEVIAETVGQFTGLTDKNGKKIFEGDIVYHGCLFNKGIGCIYYSIPTFCLCDFNNSICCSVEWERWNNFKIIGNIFDNSELIKGVK